jgi:hypothetical protein
VEGGLEGGDRGQVAGADDDGDAAVVEARLVPADAPTPPPDAAVVETPVCVFARLMPAQAARLEGKRARFRVVVAEHTPCGLWAEAPAGAEGAVELPGPRRRGEAILVEAELRFDYDAPLRDKDGTAYPEAWRCRLEKAAVVSP